MYEFIHVVCVCVCMYVCMNKYMLYVCVYVCMYVCMNKYILYVCMYVCMNKCIQNAYVCRALMEHVEKEKVPPDEEVQNLIEETFLSLEAARENNGEFFFLSPVQFFFLQSHTHTAAQVLFSAVLGLGLARYIHQYSPYCTHTSIQVYNTHWRKKKTKKRS